jgi:cellulose synthase/poly-beta-1,6-N-acetylglucosamine synthase-like glycosyltransferase
LTTASLPKVSIVITALNSEATIGECLKSIFNLNYPQDSLEVIVIDGRSRDRTVEKAKEYPVKVFVEPLNAPAAYNYAMKIVAYEVLGFVDADAKVEREWLNKLVTRLDEPHVAGVSGSIETWNAENPWARSIGYEIKNRYSRLGRYTGRIATMNLLLKKSVIEEAGGWDENLPSQYDTDLGFRLSQEGYRIAYEPDAKCYHFNRQTIRAYWRQQLQYGKNTLKLYFKHGKLAKGDEITDFGMNVQPALLLAVIVLFLLGFVPLLRLLWYGSAAILAFMFLYYVVSAARISVKFHDSTAMRLIALYFVRTCAWLSGAAITAAKYVSGDRGGKRG